MAKEPYLRAEPMQMKLLLQLRRPESDYPEGNTTDMTLSLDFYTDHVEFSLDCDEKELEPWQEVWEKITADCLGDLANFLNWLNSHKEFLGAVYSFYRSFFDKNLQGHIISE